MLLDGNYCNIAAKLLLHCSFCYIAGMDYECLCGSWESAPTSSSTPASGNSNSATGAGHGRAVGPRGMLGLGAKGPSTVEKDGGRQGAVLGVDTGVGAVPGAAQEDGSAAPSKVHPAARKPGPAGDRCNCFYSSNST